MVTGVGENETEPVCVTFCAFAVASQANRLRRTECCRFILDSATPIVTPWV